MNPSGQPFGAPGPQFGAPPPSGGNARDLLNVPSILLLAVAAIGILFGLWGMLSGGGAANAEALSKMMSDPNMPPAFKKMLEASMSMSTGPMSKVSNLVGILLNGLVIFGAIQMRNLKMYPLAITACVLTIVPCTGCCCGLGLIPSIWGLVVLMKPEVKAQFS